MLYKYIPEYISHNSLRGRSASWSAYMKPEIVILVHQISVWGIDLPLDLPMWTLTSILHVKLGKYELSELKSFILFVGCLGIFRGFGGVKKVLHPTWPYNANWLFTWPLDVSMGQLDLPVDLLIWNLKLPFLATRCQYRGDRICHVISHNALVCEGD